MCRGRMGSRRLFQDLMVADALSISSMPAYDARLKLVQDLGGTAGTAATTTTSTHTQTNPNNESTTNPKTNVHNNNNTTAPATTKTKTAT